MEAALHEGLGTTRLEGFGVGGGGCISAGSSYITDAGKVFVKVNVKDGARVMFDGEYASLEAIHNTDTVGCPRPIKVFDNPDGGAMLVTDHLEMSGLRKYSGELGTKLAQLHLHNRSLRDKQEGESGRVTKTGQSQGGEEEEAEGKRAEFEPRFGFHIQTCCGFIPQPNKWENGWVEFYARHKLQAQLDLVEKEYCDSEARTLWGSLLPKLPQLFKDVEVIPSLMHGDLWGGNAAEVEGGPVVFDPASFYGHDEFDLAIAQMFGGFSSQFFSSYHKLIPKQPKYRERLELYQLFHYLNHWNHFGGGYRGSSISILRSLNDSLK